MKDEIKELIDVYAIAYETNGNYDIKLVDAPPANVEGFAKVIEPIGEGHQLVLWVPEGTPGELAQNMATHFVPQVRNMLNPV